MQYVCGDYRKLLEANGIKASMSRKGNCLDNAEGELLGRAASCAVSARTTKGPRL